MGAVPAGPARASRSRSDRPGQPPSPPLPSPRPAPPRASSASQRPRRAPPHAYRSFPGREAFPFSRLPQLLLSPKPAPAHHVSALPSVRAPPFRTPRLPTSPTRPPGPPPGPSPALQLRWAGTGRGGPSAPPERLREAGTQGGRGGANLLGATLPWQRGEGRGEREEASGRGGCGTAAAGTAAAAACSWPRLPGGGCWKLPGAAAVLCHIVSSPSRPLPPRRGGRADGESQVERRPLRPGPPGVRAPGHQQRVRPAPGVRPGGGCPVTRPDIFVLRIWLRLGDLPRAPLGWRVGLPGGVERTGVRPREEFGVFPERYWPPGSGCRAEETVAKGTVSRGRLEVTPRTLGVRLGGIRGARKWPPRAPRPPAPRSLCNAPSPGSSWSQTCGARSPRSPGPGRTPAEPGQGASGEAPPGVNFGRLGAGALGWPGSGPGCGGGRPRHPLAPPPAGALGASEGGCRGGMGGGVSALQNGHFLFACAPGAAVTSAPGPPSWV